MIQSANPPAPENATLPVLMLRSARQHFAIQLRLIERVIPLVAMRALPGGPAHLAGLLDYQGENICAVDLAIWLGLSPIEPYNIDTPVIICRPELFEDNPVALVVSEVFGVDAINTGELQLEEQFSDSGLPFSASLHRDSGLVLLLDANQLFCCNFIKVSPDTSATIQADAGACS